MRDFNQLVQCWRLLGSLVCFCHINCMVLVCRAADSVCILCSCWLAFNLNTMQCHYSPAALLCSSPRSPTTPFSGWPALWALTVTGSEACQQQQQQQTSSTTATTTILAALPMTAALVVCSKLWRRHGQQLLHLCDADADDAWHRLSASCSVSGSPTNMPAAAGLCRCMSLGTPGSMSVKRVCLGC